MDTPKTPQNAPRTSAVRPGAGSARAAGRANSNSVSVSNPSTNPGSETVPADYLPGETKPERTQRLRALSAPERRAFNKVYGYPPNAGINSGGGPNRVTQLLKDSVAEAFYHPEVGGVGYLVRLANGTQSDRSLFVNLVGRCVPLQVVGEGGGALKIELGWLNDRAVTNRSQSATSADLSDCSARVIDVEASDSESLGPLG